MHLLFHCILKLPLFEIRPDLNEDFATNYDKENCQVDCNVHRNEVQEVKAHIVTNDSIIDVVCKQKHHLNAREHSPLIKDLDEIVHSVFHRAHCRVKSKHERRQKVKDKDLVYDCIVLICHSVSKQKSPHTEVKCERIGNRTFVYLHTLVKRSEAFSSVCRIKRGLLTAQDAESAERKVDDVYESYQPGDVLNPSFEVVCLEFIHCNANENACAQVCLEARSEHRVPEQLALDLQQNVTNA